MRYHSLFVSFNTKFSPFVTKTILHKLSDMLNRDGEVENRPDWTEFIWRFGGRAHAGIAYDRLVEFAKKEMGPMEVVIQLFEEEGHEPLKIYPAPEY